MIAHNTDSIAVRTADGAENLHMPEVTYAAWFQLLAAKPGETVNILRRMA